MDRTVTRRGTPTHRDSRIDFGAFPLFLYDDLVEVPQFEPVSFTKARLSPESGQMCLGALDPITNVRKDRVTGDVEIMPSPVNDCEFSLTFESH
jgi:hypothetical protein